jgi:hypothetical protein
MRLIGFGVLVPKTGAKFETLGLGVAVAMIAACGRNGPDGTIPASSRSTRPEERTVEGDAELPESPLGWGRLPAATCDDSTSGDNESREVMLRVTDASGRAIAEASAALSVNGGEVPVSWDYRGGGMLRGVAGGELKREWGAGSSGRAVTLLVTAPGYAPYRRVLAKEEWDGPAQGIPVMLLLSGSLRLVVTDQFGAPASRAALELLYGGNGQKPASLPGSELDGYRSYRAVVVDASGETILEDLARGWWEIEPQLCKDWDRGNDLVTVFVTGGPATSASVVVIRAESENFGSLLVHLPPTASLEDFVISESESGPWKPAFPDGDATIYVPTARGEEVLVYLLRKSTAEVQEFTVQSGDSLCQVVWYR